MNLITYRNLWNNINKKFEVLSMGPIKLHIELWCDLLVIIFSCIETRTLPVVVWA